MCKLQPNELNFLQLKSSLPNTSLRSVFPQHAIIIVQHNSENATCRSAFELIVKYTKCTNACDQEILLIFDKLHTLQLSHFAVFQVISWPGGNLDTNNFWQGTSLKQHL